jgi:hypothetical protein
LLSQEEREQANVQSPWMMAGQPAGDNLKKVARILLQEQGIVKKYPKGTWERTRLLVTKTPDAERGRPEKSR